MELSVERTELDKENNASLNNLPYTSRLLYQKPVSECLKDNEDSLKKRRLLCTESLSKRFKEDYSHSAQKLESFEGKMASGSKSSSTNQPKTPNYSGNKRFENSQRARLGVHYLDDDSDESGMPPQLGGDIRKTMDKGSHNVRDSSSKSSKNVSHQRTSLPDIAAQPSTSGEHFPSRSKDQRNFENKKRALFMKKSPNNGNNLSGCFMSDMEDYSNSATNNHTSNTKNQTKNGKKSSVTTRNHSFNGALNGHERDGDARSEGETSYPTFSRHFQSPVNKRSSRNLPEMRETLANGESSNSYSLSVEERFFPRPRLPIDKFRGQGSPPRRQNPPHHRRQTNGRNDTQSLIRNLVQSVPDVFDTEEDSTIETARNSPLRRSQTRARQVDNREIEEGESRLRFPRTTRQTLQGFSPDHQPRRRTTRVSRQTRDRHPRISFDLPVPQTETPSESVERIRQIQEDEEIARILQAEFDAEAENNVVFHINDEEDSDDSSINDVFENNNFNGEGSGSRIGVDSTSSSEVEEVDVVGSGFYRGPNGYRHYPSRANGYQHFGIGNNLTRGRRGRPRSSRANTLFHLHDIFGWAVGVDFLAENEDNSSDDYEMLWNLTERLGEVIPRGMDKREINRLPTRKFSLSSRNNNYHSDSANGQPITATPVKECQVCLSEFENNEMLRILPCFHEFHAACIDRWLKNNNTCPVCRAEVNGLNSSE